MGQPGTPDQALLFVAVAFQQQVSLHRIEHKVLAAFGQVQQRSAPFAFAQSRYYEAEMGPALQKVFVVYRDLYDIDKAVATKLQAIELEQRYAVAQKRTINIDPGYLTLAKLVLTTTKNFDHRVYLGGGIFADVQLRYRHGEFVASPWTYPDYREPATHTFLLNARTYLHQVLAA